MITYSYFTDIKRGCVGGWKSYYFTTAANHICTVKGNKWLKFDNVSILSLSLDNGATYPYSLDLAGVTDIITYSNICENGNIIFAGQTKIYYSEDNLVTYHEATVKDISGGAFDPYLYDNFKSLFHHVVIQKNGIELMVSHSYSIYEQAGKDPLIHGFIWYTIDNGKTFKMCFKKGTSIGGFVFRHINGLNYDAVHGDAGNDVFWMDTGDAGFISLVKGTYSWATDTWNWEQIVSDETRHLSGITFHGDTFYWGDDTGGTVLGLWKGPYSKITDLTDTYWTKVQVAYTKQSNFWDAGDGLILAHDSGLWTQFHYSLDHGETWTAKALVGGPAIDINGWIFCPSGPDSNYWFRYEIQENYPAAELSYTSPMGIVLMVQIIPTKGSN